MADKKISELTNITGANLADTDEFVVVDTSASETKAITYGELKKINGNLTFADNGRAIFGAGSDLQIYHNGSNSFIEDVAGTGSLYIRSNQTVFTNPSGTENVAVFNEDADVRLFHNGAIKLATTSTGVDVTGTITSDGLTVDGSITATGGDLNIATLDLNAIAATKAVTAVDVFVYDTSKDSDGGAWRKRTQHTSWYNETLNTSTRGSRREFPAVAVIVAEAAKVTIYDGDDPSLPMWAIIDVNTTFTSVFAVNGVICVTCSTAGIVCWGFVDETLLRYISSGKQSQPWTRDATGSNFVTIDAGSGIVSNVANDVAMTVLPNAPIDPATGLPVPTIAVATDGGVSVIKDDGTVVDSAYTGTVGKVVFTETGIWYIRNQSTYVFSFATYDDISAGDGFGDAFGRSDGAGDIDLLVSGHKGLEALGSQIALAGNTISSISVPGLMLHQPNYTDQSKGMSALTTSSYNTGWMNGDIKGAFLSDTDDTDLVGSGELVTNGTFDTDLTGWTQTGTVFSQSGGALVIDASLGSSSNLYLEQPFTDEAGKVYKVSFDIVSRVAGQVDVRFRGGAAVTHSAAYTVGSHTFFLTGNGTNNKLSVSSNSNGDMTIDNISVQLADADRSVNNKGLIVNGTVTRTPVATGADLVAYSGFSASNYLEQPYNSDLDFGTGDFCVMGWSKTTATNETIIDRGAYSGGYSGAHFEVLVDVAGKLKIEAFGATSGTDSVVSTGSANTGQWQFLAVVKDGSNFKLFINGVLDKTQAVASVGGFTNTSAAMRIGIGLDGAYIHEGSLALWRISATAPTADQIKKIYEDEKVLFQENAAATLYGAYDSVNALAHDSDTGLLHVGTSAGRSVFQGLRRVSNTTTAVETAISASNGLVVEE